MEKLSTNPVSTNEEQKINIGIIGAGRFAEAIATLLAKNENIEKITLHTKNETDAKKAREQDSFLNFSSGENNIPSLPEKIHYSHDPKEIVNETTDIVFSLLGAQDTPKVINEQFKEILKKESEHIQAFLSGTKGIIQESRQTISQFLRSSLGDDFVDKKYGYFYGPMFADLVIKNHPTTIGLSAFNDDIVTMGKNILKSDTITVTDTNKTVEGAEFISAFKNVAAIASGMSLGLYGENTAYSIQNVVIKELKYLTKKLGIKKISKVFKIGSPAMSDLFMTCNSPKSRNFKTGFNTTAPKNDHYTNNGLAEGIETIKAIYKISQENNINIEDKMPICHAVYRILHQNKSPEALVPIVLKKIERNQTKNK